MCSQPLILVTGASGALGPRVVDALYNAGYRIRTLSLDPVPKGVWPDIIETRIGDVTDPITVDKAMNGATYVIHMAALLHINDPDPTLEKKYQAINVGGTATVVEAAIQSNVTRVVFMSTIAVYGKTNGQIVNECTIPKPDTLYGLTKLDAEEIVLKAKRNNEQPIGTVLRLGAVYGASIKGNYRRLLHSLARGRFIPIGSGQNRRSLIYDKDVADAVVLALHHPAAAGQIFNVCDRQFHTVKEIIEVMCKALGRSLPRFTLPSNMVRYAAGILEDGAKILGLKSPIVRATIDKYTEDIAVDSSRIQSQVGFVPQYDLDHGWRETIEHMRLMGDL